MLKSSKVSKMSMIATMMLLVFSMLLAACGDGVAKKESASPTVNETVEPAETPANLPEVKLIYYFLGAWPQPDQEEVFAEVNKIVKAKINATIDFRPSSIADYDQKIKLVIASGEPYDIAFTANWINNYSLNVAKGAFLPLDDLFVKYAPKSFASVPKSFWEAAKVQGKIYGFINEQISARTPGVTVSKAFAEKYKLDFNALSGKINGESLNLLEPYIQTVLKDYPKALVGGFTLVGMDGFFFNLEPIAGIKVPGSVDFSDNNLKVVNQFETASFRKYAATMRDWNAKGWTNSKERISKPDNAADGSVNGMTFGIGGTYKPGGDVLGSINAKMPLLEIPSGTPHLTTGGIIATMNAINTNSKNPERAMMFLELLNTDKELFNLLNFGIKGKHFTLDAEGFMIKEGDAAKAYQPNVPWALATNFLAYVQKGMPKTVWEDTKKLNASAIPSKLLGFSFDAEPVKAEIGKTSTVIDEYARGIELGVITEEKYNEFLAKLKTAGSDTIIAEMQKQINAWKATK